MSKAVLISIQPKWCEKIANGEKTVEVRKSRPKLEAPFKCYIYCTQGYGKNTFCIPITAEQIRKDYERTGSMKCLTEPIGNCKVIGEFVCDEFTPYCNARPIRNAEEVERGTCLSREEIWEYVPGGNPIGWHISDLVIYDKPKLLSEFGVKRPPQSWCYVEELTTV